MFASIMVQIIGVIFFGYIIASVAASLANADAQRARFQQKLSSIKMCLQVVHVFVNLSDNLQRCNYSIGNTQSKG